MDTTYQLLLVFGVVILILNVRNKIFNYKAKGKTLYKFMIDNKIMNITSGIVFAMLVLMGASIVTTYLAGNSVPGSELFQFFATVILFIAVGINSYGSTVITEAGIIKNNNLVKWELIKNVEWTGFNGKSCKLMIDYMSKKSMRTMRITVKEDKEEKNQVTALLKQYRKAAKKNK